MMGSYDFCGHYEWTFDGIERVGGPSLVREYWQSAISEDSQRHARELILREGIAGMAKYWGRTLAEESPDFGYSIAKAPDVFRIDIHACPSKGFLLRNGLEQYHDYCDHCMGWIGPLMREAGFVIDHEHNHCGQFWWEMRPAGAAGGHSVVTEVSEDKDVRLRPNWMRAGGRPDRYNKATDTDGKMP